MTRRIVLQEAAPVERRIVGEVHVLEEPVLRRVPCVADLPVEARARVAPPPACRGAEQPLMPVAGVESRVVGDAIDERADGLPASVAVDRQQHVASRGSGRRMVANDGPGENYLVERGDAGAHVLARTEGDAVERQPLGIQVAHGDQRPRTSLPAGPCAGPHARRRAGRRSSGWTRRAPRESRRHSRGASKWKVSAPYRPESPGWATIHPPYDCAARCTGPVPTSCAAQP